MDIPSGLIYGLMVLSALLIVLGGWKDMRGHGKCRYGQTGYGGGGSGCPCGKTGCGGCWKSGGGGSGCPCGKNCGCGCQSNNMYSHISAQHLWTDGLWIGILALFLQQIKSTQ